MSMYTPSICRLSLWLAIAGAIGAASTAAASPVAMRFDGVGFSQATINGFFKGEDRSGDGWLSDYIQFQDGPTGNAVPSWPYGSGVPEIDRAMLTVKGKNVDFHLDTAHPTADNRYSVIIIDFEMATGAFKLSAYKAPPYYGTARNVNIYTQPDGKPNIETGCLAGDRGCYLNFRETGTGYSLTAVPEPSTWALAAAGLGIAAMARRQRRSRG